jgi:hypothetical protein
LNWYNKAICYADYAHGIRRVMKFFDISVLGLVSLVFLSRFPSPVNSLKCDFIFEKASHRAVCGL